MYQFLALLTGMLISVMVSVNGNLSGSFGVFYAAVIIHIAGVIFSFFLCLLRGEKLFRAADVPPWAYLGGVIGVLTTLFNNYSCAYISMTSIVALGLLGQCISSNILDAFGLFGMKKRPIRGSVWFGIALSCVGVVIMLDSSVAGGLSAVLLSLSAGVTIVMARTVNARLSAETGALAGSFYNHLAGLPVCVVLALIFSSAGAVDLHALRPWMFCGGMMGVLTVMLLNITVPRLSSFRLTLLSFLGQISTGIVIDLAFRRAVSPRLFWGCVICTAGLLGGMILEWKSTKGLDLPAADIN